jgi:2-C-methyl-D-erythritol 2,4-cyclodiphosphate synthase
MKKILILLCGGSGVRFGQDKSLTTLAGKPFYEWGIDNFRDFVDDIFIVASQQNIDQIKTKHQKVLGGATRFESVKNGIKKANPSDEDILIIHNVANVFVSSEEICECISKCLKHGASGVAHKPTSTIRHKDGEIVDRDQYWLMETPQCLRYSVFEQGLQKVKNQSKITDDLILASLAGCNPCIIEAHKLNKKITYKEDLDFYEYIFAKSFYKMPDHGLKIGLGHDSHRFSCDNSKPCMIGGVEFFDVPALSGNSDADVCLHALINAILSAIQKGSLSRFADDMCKTGVTDSADYLEVALWYLNNQNLKIQSISISIEAARPKLEAHLDKIEQNIARLCDVPPDVIGLTCTSGEKLTAFGRGEGVQVFCTVLVSK